MSLVLNAQGQPVNGWWGGKYYISGVQSSPFKLVTTETIITSEIVEYDSGDGFKPFTGWASVFGKPDMQYVNGIPVTKTATSPTPSTPAPVPAGGTTPAGTASSTPVSSLGSYPNPHLWLADDSLKVLLKNDANNDPVLMVPYPLASDFCGNNNVWDGSRLALKGLRNEMLAFQLFLSPDATSGWNNITFACSIPGCTVTPKFEWYTALPPLSGGDANPIWKPGDMIPDALIPFVDPYKNTPIITSFDVPYGETQGIWFDVKIGPSAISSTGTLDVFVNGTLYKSIPITLTVKSVSIQRPKLKAAVPLYSNRFIRGEGIAMPDGQASPAFGTMAQRYQVAFHEHGLDTWIDQIPPSITWDANDMPTVDWAPWDAWIGPSLDGSLFGDGTSLTVVNSILQEETNLGIPWSYTSNTLPPAQLLTRLTNLAREIASHFAAKGYKATDILAYIWDEPGGKVGTASDIWQVVLAYAKALEGTGIKMFVTCPPYDMNPNDAPENLADYANLVPVVPIFGMTAPTYVPSKQPAAVESWFYQYGEPFCGKHTLYADGVALRSWGWLAEYYNVPGVFLWCANFWGDGNHTPSPTDKTQSPYFYAITDGDGGDDGPGAGDGVLCYPGSQLPLLNPAWPAMEGPVMSMRIASIRRGMQDAAIMEMLKAEGKTVPALPIVDANLPFGLNPNDVHPYWNVENWMKPGNWSHDPQVWDALRLQMEKALG